MQSIIINKKHQFSSIIIVLPLEIFEHIISYCNYKTRCLLISTCYNLRWFFHKYINNHISLKFKWNRFPSSQAKIQQLTNFMIVWKDNIQTIKLTFKQCNYQNQKKVRGIIENILKYLKVNNYSIIHKKGKFYNNYSTYRYTINK